MAKQSVTVSDPQFVTVRRVTHNAVTYEPDTEFPGAGNECTDADLAALLKCGAIREPNAPPKPAPTKPPKLGDEELPSGDARHVARHGSTTDA